MQCSAKSKRTGKPCGSHAIRGTTVCRMHGGSSPQVRAVAARRLAEEDALAQLAQMEIVPVADPLEELALLAGEALAWKQLLRDRVSQLTSLGYEGATGEQVRAAVSLYGAALDRLERVLASIARLRIDERLAHLDERRTALMERVIRAVFADTELGLTGEQLALTDGLVARHLRTVS